MYASFYVIFFSCHLSKQLQKRLFQTKYKKILTFKLCVVRIYLIFEYLVEFEPKKGVCLMFFTITQHIKMVTTRGQF